MKTYHFKLTAKERSKKLALLQEIKDSISQYQDEIAPMSERERAFNEIISLTEQLTNQDFNRNY